MALPMLAMGSMLGADNLAQGDLEGALQESAIGVVAPAIGLGLLGRGYNNPAMRAYLGRGLIPESARRTLSGAGARMGAMGAGLLGGN